MSQVPIKTAFDFFYHLESQNFSGEVQVTSSQGHALLLIQEGQLIWAHRPIERAVEKWSKLNWLHLPSSSAIATCRDWADFVSQVFHLNPDNFRRWMDLLKMDRLEVFYRIFFWKNLEFISRPFAVETPPSTLAFYSPRKLSILLTEAKRRVEEWPRIREKIGSSQRLFISNLVLNSSTSDKSSLPYSEEELDLVGHCDGTHSVEDLVRIQPEGEFLVLRRLVDLWRKGVIRPRDEESPILPPKFRETFDRNDALALVLGMFLIFGISLSVQVFQSRVPEIPSPVEFQTLSQVLDLYRLREGHYPLTLSEILPDDDFNFEYRLIAPERFELRQSHSSAAAKQHF